MRFVERVQSGQAFGLTHAHKLLLVALAQVGVPHEEDVSPVAAPEDGALLAGAPEAGASPLMRLLAAENRHHLLPLLSYHLRFLLAVIDQVKADSVEPPTLLDHRQFFFTRPQLLFPTLDSGSLAFYRANFVQGTTVFPVDFRQAAHWPLSWPLHWAVSPFPAEPTSVRDYTESELVHVGANIAIYMLSMLSKLPERVRTTFAEAIGGAFPTPGAELRARLAAARRELDELLRAQPRALESIVRVELDPGKGAVRLGLRLFESAPLPSFHHRSH